MNSKIRSVASPRRFAAVATVAVLSIGVAGCSGSSSEGEGGGQTVTVLAEDISYTDNWKELLPQFEEETDRKSVV